MAPVRVRGCADRVSMRRDPYRQADASRRRNGPRKADKVVTTPRRPITERLSRKSCPAGWSDTDRHREKAASGDELRKPQQASVGTKTRSDGRVPAR